jgi:hypothetical protein
MSDPVIISRIPDLRGVPLAELGAFLDADDDGPEAAFQSSI